MDQYVPPTPAPTRRRDLVNEHQHKFTSVILYNSILEDPESMLNYRYDRWEHYDEEKSYSQRPYILVVDGICSTYENHLLCMNRPEGETHYYVVSIKIGGKLDHLVKYCPCTLCRGYFWNPFKYSGCVNCHGCLRAGPEFAKPKYIDYANGKLKESMVGKKSTNKYKYIALGVCLIGIASYSFFDKIH